MLALALGCAPQPAPEPAALEAICGREGPVPLVALDGDLELGVAEDAELYVATNGTVRIGDRLFFGIAGATGPVDGPDGDVVVSVGACGESAVALGTGLSQPVERARYPGTPLACRHDDWAILRLDPMGAAAPAVVFGAEACRGVWTADHIVFVNVTGAGTASVLVWDLPEELDGPMVESRVLVEEFEGRSQSSVAAFDDEVFALDLSGQVVRVALADGSSTVERAGVARFEVSEDRRFLAYMTSYEEAEDGFIRGALTVRNRQTGQEVTLPEGILALTDNIGVGGFVRVWTSLEPLVIRVLDLETFEVHEIPDDHVAVRPIPDGRWLVSDRARTSWWLRDLATGEMTALDIRGAPNIHDAWIFDEASMDIIDAYGLSGPLRRIPYDGAPAQALADEVYRGFAQLADDRIVTFVDPETERRLLVVDPSEGSTHTLADKPWLRPLVAGARLGLGERDIVYGAHIDGVSAIWRARLGAR